jgi:hypothetical protein
VEPGGAPYLNEYQAELIDRSDAEALHLAVQEILQTEDYLGEVGARENAYTQARRMVFEIMARTGRALEMIHGLEVVVELKVPDDRVGVQDLARAEGHAAVSGPAAVRPDDRSDRTRLPPARSAVARARLACGGRAGLASPIQLTM